MKWMDKPSVTEMDRGDFYFHFRDTSSFHFCDTWSVHPFHRHFLYHSNYSKQKLGIVVFKAQSKVINLVMEEKLLGSAS